MSILQSHESVDEIEAPKLIATNKEGTSGSATRILTKKVHS
jgi:hypothetical protein